MIPRTTLNQVQLAVKAADTFHARSIQVVSLGPSSVLLRGTVPSLRDIDAAKKAIRTVLPQVDISTSGVTISSK